MKVLSDSKGYEIKCPHCHAKLEITEADVQLDYGEHVRCPACGKRIALKRSTFGNRLSVDGWNS